MARRKEKPAPPSAAGNAPAAFTPAASLPPPTTAQKWFLGLTLAAEALWLAVLLAMALA